MCQDRPAALPRGELGLAGPRASTALRHGDPAWDNVRFRTSQSAPSASAPKGLTHRVARERSRGPGPWALARRADRPREH
ncbi:hypothetical protein SGPA1_41209 [Streptomyces misionensis JCM 4497]